MFMGLMAIYCVPDTILICSIHHIMPHIVYSLGYILADILIVYSSGSSWLLKEPEYQIKWGYGRSHHCCLLQELNAGTRLCHTPPWVMILFLSYSLGGDSFRVSHSTVPIIIPLTPEARDIMWGWLHLPSVSI